MISIFAMIILIAFFIYIGNKYYNKKTYLFEDEYYEVSFKSGGKGDWLQSKVKRLSNGTVEKNCDHERAIYNEVINSTYSARAEARKAITFLLERETVKKFFNGKDIENLNK